MPLPALFPLLLNTLIGAKLVSITVSLIASPTNASTRRSLVAHVEHVRDGLRSTKATLTEEEDAELIAKLTILRDSAGIGWISPEETSALVHVLKFLSWSHSKGTAEGLYKMTELHLLAASDAAERAGLRILDIFMPGKNK